jgi:uncharacterized protein
VPQDYVQAHTWLNLAASRYDAAHQKERDEAVKTRDIVAAKMTPALSRICLSTHGIRGERA